MIKYSVIMPVFNAIDLIEKNLEKFKRLNRSDIELIVINDGSDDGSKEIMETYKNKINHLILVHQDNKGVSYARNIGIEKASGKYVTFLDCDDSIEEDFFNRMDNIYDKEYDLIRYGIYRITKNRKTKQQLVQQETIYHDFYKNKERNRLIYTTNQMNTVWNQMIRTQILKENKIFFNIEHKYAEDFEFNRKLMNYITTACFLPDCLYDYYINENSISRTENQDNIMKCIKDTIAIHTQTYFECKEKRGDLLEDTFKNISLEFMTTIRRIFFVDKIKINEIYHILEQLTSLEEIRFLQNEKKVNHWKTNSFIDNCVYKKCNYQKILFYKYYFKLKKVIKNILD